MSSPDPLTTHTDLAAAAAAARALAVTLLARRSKDQAPGLIITPGTVEALTRLETELIHRRRLMDAADTTDFTTCNLAMDLGERMDSLTFLIRDRDTTFTTAFDEVFRAGGVRIIKTPPQAPRANAICERVIGTLRHEVFDHMLIYNERHLSKVLTEYAEHYDQHRPHQSRDQRPPTVETTVVRPITDLADIRSIRRQPILDGLISQYHRAA